MFDEIPFNLPPVLPGYRRCEVCRVEMPQNVYNRQYCTVRCRKKAENARRKQRDKALYTVGDTATFMENNPTMQARTNMTKEQLEALCVYARTNPKEYQQIPGTVPRDFVLPEGFEVAQGPLAWLLIYNPAGDAHAKPYQRTIEEAANEKIQEKLKNL